MTLYFYVPLFNRTINKKIYKTRSDSFKSLKKISKYQVLIELFRIEMLLRCCL